MGTVPPPLAGPSPQGKGLSTPVSLSCPFSDRLTAFRYVFDVCPSIKIQPNDNSPRKVSSGSTILAKYSYLADGTRTGAIAPISAIGSAVKTAVQVTSVITDAAVDYDMKDGLQVVGSTEYHKDPDVAFFDLLCGASGSAIGSTISNGLAESSMKDISGNALCTVSKETKNLKKAIANTLNSSTVKFAEQEAVSAATSAVKETVKYEINNPPAKTQVYMYFIQGTTDDEYQPYHYEQGK